MSKSDYIRQVIPAGRRGWFRLPAEGAEICLNPTESTLLRLFMAHPSGICADDLILHWQELNEIYAHESRFDDQELREKVLASLCAESKRVFYSNISRIKRKFVKVLGTKKAAGYYIKRNKAGLYRTNAVFTAPLSTPCLKSFIPR